MSKPFKATKKPVTIEAMEMGDVDSVLDILDWIDDCGAYAEVCRLSNELEIHTLEGKMTASKGDYIIKDVNGEFYPIKSDIFKKTYDF